MTTMTVDRANLVTISAPAATIWRVDPARSVAEFSVGNRILRLVKNRVNGRFRDISGTIVLDERDLRQSRAEISIDASSLDTGIARRDKHLKDSDFFDVERFPRLTFTSRDIRVVDAEAGRYQATGDLTVRGVTRPITLDVAYRPSFAAAGVTRIRLSATTTVNRRDFGIDYQSLVGRPADEALVKVEIEAVQEI